MAGIPHHTATRQDLGYQCNDNQSDLFDFFYHARCLAENTRAAADALWGLVYSPPAVGPAMRKIAMQGVDRYPGPVNRPWFSRINRVASQAEI
jgi:hypothetical protein